MIGVQVVLAARANRLLPDTRSGRAIDNEVHALCRFLICFAAYLSACLLLDSLQSKAQRADGRSFALRHCS